MKELPSSAMEKYLQKCQAGKLERSKCQKWAFALSDNSTENLMREIMDCGKCMNFAIADIS